MMIYLLADAEYIYSSLLTKAGCIVILIVAIILVLLSVLLISKGIIDIRKILDDKKVMRHFE